MPADVGMRHAGKGVPVLTDNMDGLCLNVEEPEKNSYCFSEEKRADRTGGQNIPKARRATGK